MKTYGVSASRLDSYGRYQPRNRSALNRATVKNLWQQQRTALANSLYVTVDASAASINNVLTKINQQRTDAAKQAAFDELFANLKPINVGSSSSSGSTGNSVDIVV
ncbi:hypothetical protein HDIA_0541 [Hartmannibacter diazotrophicus]|uniref:Uncharacterized protein n=1 Tax=Hartmannibacter diazotrophicus TaxID=1482074 RepID=A0A2C9D186_9HYPH|nr:hypothetical protein [Hartmannibacter diazotrophicus]SON54082.1 hypothetical protein HDIA_0541 [Hartmannibacter diazotrophicus]